jgi:hypothetical protein
LLDNSRSHTNKIKNKKARIKATHATPRTPPTYPRQLYAPRHDAALTQAPDGHEVTTVEYKINFLAAFQDGELRARGLVIRAGKKLIVTTAEVVHLDADGKESPCALMQQTIAVVEKRY